MNPLIIILGVLLIIIGCTAGLWTPFPISVLVAIIFGFSGGWLIAQGFDNR